MNKPYAFAVLGNAVVDAIARVDDAFLERFKLKKADSNTVSTAEMIQLSSHIMVEQFRSGGSAANTAYTLAKLGCRTSFIGLIGADPTGRHFAEDMVEAGVTVTPLNGSVRTTEVFVLLTPDGVRTMVQAAPNMPSADDSWIEDDLIEKASYLLIGAYAAGSHPAAVEYAAKVAHQSGAKLVLSLAAPRAVLAAQETLRTLVTTYQPLVIGNVKEWQLLLESTDAYTQKALEKTPRVLTRSGQGATFYGADGTVVDSPTQPIPRPTDLSGAGDAFAAGFLHIYTGGGSPNLALAHGHQLGRTVVLSLGPRIQTLPAADNLSNN